MSDIKYNPLPRIRLARYFDECTEDEQEMELQHLGEEMIENAKIIDSWMSDIKGFKGNKFDTNNNRHRRLFAKLTMLNAELEEIFEAI